jgi:large conductance mechanosensitive channel
MLREFRDFALKGNFLDLAIGVVIGAAFGATTTAFVVNLINPLIGLAAGGQDFTNLFVTLKDGAKVAGPYDTLKAAQDAGAVTLNIGLFLNALINLILVAFVMFLIVKGYNKAMKKQEEAPAPPPEPSAEELLLAEIRDLLKAQQG